MTWPWLLAANVKGSTRRPKPDGALHPPAKSNYSRRPTHLSADEHFPRSIAMSTDAFALARRLRAGEVVYTGWCGLPYPMVAEVVAREGFVAVTLDAQHGLWDVSAMVTGIAAVRQGGAAPIVRVPVGDFSSVS